MLWLWLGRWPTHDFNGKAYAEGTIEWERAHVVVWLADGYYGLLWVFRGDLDFFNIFLNFPKDSAMKPCGLCG